MKKLLSLLLLAATPLFANPFLVCPAVTSGISNSPASYTVSGLPNSPITSNAVTITSGTVQLDLDLGPAGQNVPTGSYTVSATATNPNGTSASSPNFALTISAPAFVQGAAAHATTTVSSIAKAYTGAQTSGNANVIMIGGVSGFVVSSVTDTKGNTYNSVATGNVGGIQVAAYVATGIASASAGSNTVTVTFSAGTNSPDIHILEYSGLASSGVFDSSDYVNGTGTSASATFSTSNANDVIIASLLYTGTPTITAGTGYTMRVNEGPSWGNCTEDQVVSSSGSQTASFSISSSQSWWVFAIALK